jgi:hypothetical protein
MLIRKTKPIYGIAFFDSCNGAQEVEGRATHATVALTLGSGFATNVTPVLTLPLPIFKGYPEPEKGESL